MPDMDGVTLAARIKADPLLANIHMIMLTSLGTRLPENVMAELGIAQWLQKPVRQSELYNAMASVVAHARQSEHAAAEKLTVHESKPAQSIRILLAEDNPVNQKVALRQLQKLGYTAEAVANGSEALEALGRMRYDVILMDCHMPELDGFATTKALRNHPTLHGIYIIAMTANAMQGDRERCLSEGMNDYVSKPTRLSDLEAVLRKAIAVLAEQSVA